jgi:hypothetical protein
MAVNVSKTKFIIFHSKGKRVDPGVSLIYEDTELNQNTPT